MVQAAEVVAVRHDVLHARGADGVAFAQVQLLQLEAPAREGREVSVLHLLAAGQGQVREVAAVLGQRQDGLARDALAAGEAQRRELRTTLGDRHDPGILYARAAVHVQRFQVVAKATDLQQRHVTEFADLGALAYVDLGQIPATPRHLCDADVGHRVAAPKAQHLQLPAPGSECPQREVVDLGALIEVERLEVLTTQC